MLRFHSAGLAADMRKQMRLSDILDTYDRGDGRYPICLSDLTPAEGIRHAGGCASATPVHKASDLCTGFARGDRQPNRVAMMSGEVARPRRGAPVYPRVRQNAAVSRRNRR